MCPKLKKRILEDTLGDPQAVTLEDLQSLEQKGSQTTAATAA